MRLALPKPARFEPGTDFSYSNTNHTLAALLTEQAETFPKALDRLVKEVFRSGQATV